MAEAPRELSGKPDGGCHGPIINQHISSEAIPCSASIHGSSLVKCGLMLVIMSRAGMLLFC